MAFLIINTTERCNANCYYCYVVHRENINDSMTPEMLEVVFIRINEFLTAYPDKSIEILWHGGEPLLMGPEFFRNVIKLENSICNSIRDRINHAIQTNLTLLTEEYIDIFGQLGINTVGTSFDPVPHMRGLGRKNDSGKYNKMFMKALGLLERRGIDWGMIYVITKNSLKNPLGVFFYLTNLTLTGVINLNPVLIDDEKRKDVAISPKEYARFLGDIFPYWWKKRQLYPNVQPFKGLVESIIKGKVGPGCMEFGVCDSAYHHINLNPDGETSQSGLSPNWESPRYGNIRDKSLEEILFNEEMNRFEEKIEEMRAKDCRECSYLELCNPRVEECGGTQNKSLMHKSEWCESRIAFIENYFEPVTGVKYEPNR